MAATFEVFQFWGLLLYIDGICPAFFTSNATCVSGVEGLNLTLLNF